MSVRTIRRLSLIGVGLVAALGMMSVITATPPSEVVERIVATGKVKTEVIELLNGAGEQEAVVQQVNDLTQSGGGWKVKYRRVTSFRPSLQNRQDIKYNFAWTTRLEGTGPHELEVHGALVEDWNGDKINRYDFDSVISHNEIAVGGTNDSWHDGNGEDWLRVSSHYYDHGDNGSLDGMYFGCFDSVVQMD